MTPSELLRLRSADGLWLLADARYPSMTMPVVTMGASEEQPGRAYNLVVGKPLGTDLSLWNPSTYVVSGPHSVQMEDALSQKASEVAEYVELIEHDLAFWRDCAIEAATELPEGHPMWRKIEAAQAAEQAQHQLA